MRGIFGRCHFRNGRVLPRIQSCGVRQYAKRVTKSVVLEQGLQYGAVALPALPQLSNGLDTETDHAKQNALQYSTVLQGALNNMQDYPHCIVLTRVGGFYELYFNHAEDLHQELGLKRSYRETKLGPVAMAGFPFFQLDRYLKILVEDMHKSVAISEEFTRSTGPDGKGPIDLNNKNLFERRVSRIVTPGTLIDEKFLESENHNFLLSARSSSTTPREYGLAWMDLSTGEFFTQDCEAANLKSHLMRISPKEVIVSMDFDSSVLTDFIVTNVPTLNSPSRTWRELVRGSQDCFTDVEALAGSALLEYVACNLPESCVSTIPPVKQVAADTMSIDSDALYSLEIRKSMRYQTPRGSLLHTIKRTLTQSGCRLLQDWLVSPITSVTQLNQRLDLVQLLKENEPLKIEICRHLKGSGDAVRVLQRFGFGRGEVDDLITITRAIKVATDLANLLAKYPEAHHLCSRLTDLADIKRKITSSVDEDGLLQRNRENAESAAAMMEEVLGAMNSPLKNVERRRKAIEREVAFTMKPSASAVLREAHKNLDDMMLERTNLENSLKVKTGASTLTLKTLPGLSHIVHVKGADCKLDMNSFIPACKSVGSTRSTRSYHVPEWSYLGTRIEADKIRIQQEEAKAFQKLRRDVLRQSSKIRQNARVLDELDLAQSFAEIAAEHGWVRPHLTREQTTSIVNGRHPVVDQSLRTRGLQFTPNSTYFDSSDSIYLVTGTNMGGKSTYLRQVAVIQILAQIGSFVPAEAATIGICDAIFSRLGSSDNLYQNESTFMCEMKETAFILEKATGASLVLMDEVGRGTTSIDGTAIAYACLKALRDKKCRTLFATHFHELAALVRDWECVGLLCTDIIENPDGTFAFDHEIKEGVCQDSHGLKVAALAGVPTAVIRDAGEMQSKLLALRS